VVGVVEGGVVLLAFAAHRVMDTIQSVRALACSSEACWGATIEADLPMGMVALGVDSVAGVGWRLWGAGTERVSVSSRTLTRLLIVLRIFSTGGMVTGGPFFETRPEKEMGESAIDSNKGRGEGKELRAEPRWYS
jgi:hypothetical protein